MTIPDDALVFDTGPLRHFATQGWLAVLRFLAGERKVYIPDSVARELNEARDSVPAVGQALDADWINVYRSTSLHYAEAFAGYRDRLVVDGKNVGECGVLAMGKVYGCELVLDDAVPRQIAEDERIKVTATVPMLCEAVRAKQLTMVMVEQLADDLLEGDYFLPFGRGGFRQHVLEHGLLDYDEL
ncbi:nucleotide-binding protein [Streptomyces ipomoeae]|uniref:nucleotide-binding protein n=1 Tax=Streptomyces ipomoeae TaxID=103232 RepID=UPI0015F0E9EF|nr:nucleotide-binding protein [Streptomyces ipomoeae]